MKQDSGFSKKQKDELGSIIKVAIKEEFKQQFANSFSEQFKEVLLPSLDKMSDDLEDIKTRIGKLEEKITVVDEKLDELRLELTDIKRRLDDLENDTPTMTSFLSLKARVESLEKKFGITER
jgi:predicted nuclease with TOPRIM domain